MDDESSNKSADLDTTVNAPAVREQRQDNGNAYDATVVAAGQSCSKMERDIAFAAAVLNTGRLSERQLTKAVSDWTVHGDEPLEQHLRKKDLISDLDCKKLAAETDRGLQDAVEDLAATPSDESRGIVHRLDTSGRVGRLLGLSIAPDWESTGDERSVTSSYRLLKKLGQGGLGCVWLARDENLNRFVAVKEITEAACKSPAAIKRFRREAEVTGRLEHPSIVPVYQFGGETEEGHSFYAMRYLGKQTLEDAIAEYHERREAGEHGPMLLHGLLTSFVAVCQAIAYAHSRDVVHRDLKPENVALDNFGQVIVLDWGLAKLIGDAELDENLAAGPAGRSPGIDQTLSGQVLGTPMYMAPEQAAGRNDEIDPRTDVYGLGAILFAILTGYAPHEKSHASLSSSSKVSELFRSIVGNPTPSARSLLPEVSPELDAICAKAMAGKAYARYATASELAEDVQKWMAGEPVSAYAEPWQQSLRRWVGSHRLISQIAAVLFTVLVVVVTTLSVTSRQNRLAARQAQFKSLKTDGRELRVQLEHGMRNLVKEVRFMSSLPPIQGIIDARTGEGAEDEQVWNERLETIYQGLLHAKSDFLSIKYVSTAEPAREVVRVERQAGDGSFVRVVPESRLATIESSAALDRITSLDPGDVYVFDGTLAAPKTESEDRQRLVLTAGIPVFDDNTGEVFGAVVIHANLEKALREFILTTSNAAAAIHIVDGDGKVALRYSRGGSFRRLATRPAIGTLVPELATFFSQRGVGVFSDDEAIYAIKVPLDERHSDITLGIVLMLN